MLKSPDATCPTRTVRIRHTVILVRMLFISMLPPAYMADIWVFGLTYSAVFCKCHNYYKSYYFRLSTTIFLLIHIFKNVISLAHNDCMQNNCSFSFPFRPKSYLSIFCQIAAHRSKKIPITLDVPEPFVLSSLSDILSIPFISIKQLHFAIYVYRQPIFLTD